MTNDCEPRASRLLDCDRSPAAHRSPRCTPKVFQVLLLPPARITKPLQEEPHVTRHFHLIPKEQKNKTLDCQTCSEIEGEGKQGKEYVAVGSLASTMPAGPATDHHIVGGVFPVLPTAKLRSHPARGTSFEQAEHSYFAALAANSLTFFWLSASRSAIGRR